jgi:hypothetical protein
MNIDQLEAENRELRDLVFKLGDRLVICARLLGRCAERKPCAACDKREEDAKAAAGSGNDIANDSRPV